MVNKHNSNWNHFLLSSLWSYQTSTKNATGFTSFHLFHSVELVLPIEFHISSLYPVVEIIPDTSPLEKCLLMLEQTDEDSRVSLQMIEAAKTRSKSHYDSHVHSHTFREWDLILIYDQARDKNSKGKLESMWYGPYVIH